LPSGRNVWIADIHAGAAEALAASLPAARAIELDVTSTSSIAAAVQGVGVSIFSSTMRALACGVD